MYEIQAEWRGGCYWRSTYARSGTFVDRPPSLFLEMAGHGLFGMPSGCSAARQSDAIELHRDTAGFNLAASEHAKRGIFGFHVVAKNVVG